MVMIYFSGTGNSKFIAEQFARRMQIPAHSIDFDGLLAQEDTVAVCYPIYGSCVPRIMREFVEKHRAGFAGKKQIILCTQMMFSGDGARAFSRLLPACEVRYAEHFSMPNNICNIAVFPMSERERQEKPEKALRQLDQVCEDHPAGDRQKAGLERLFGAARQDAERRLSPDGEQGEKLVPRGRELHRLRGVRQGLPDAQFGARERTRHAEGQLHALLSLRQSVPEDELHGVYPQEAGKAVQGDRPEPVTRKIPKQRSAAFGRGSSFRRRRFCYRHFEETRGGYLAF